MTSKCTFKKEKKSESTKKSRKKIYKQIGEVPKTNSLPTCQFGRKHSATIPRTNNQINSPDRKEINKRFQKT